MVFSQAHSRAFEEASGRFGRGSFNVYFVVSPFLSIIFDRLNNFKRYFHSNVSPGESIANLPWKKFSLFSKWL